MKNKIFTYFSHCSPSVSLLLRVPTIWKEILTLFFQKKMRLRTLIIFKDLLK